MNRVCNSAGHELSKLCSPLENVRLIESFGTVIDVLACIAGIAATGVTHHKRSIIYVPVFPKKQKTCHVSSLK